MANQRMLNAAVRVASIALLTGVPIVAASGTIAQSSPRSSFITEPQLIAQQTRPRRTALVIGNGAYQLQKRLPNPTNDAADMTKALRDLGFEVIFLPDGNRQQMNAAIGQFKQKLRQGGVGLFYYAGHGMEVKGANYLIPIDAKIEDEFDAPDVTVPLGKVLDAMAEAKNPMNLIILDACRDNPFLRRGRSSSSKGLASVQSAEGMFISFATAPGRVADDGRDRNSPFTASLLQQMRKPNVPIEQTFKAVRQSVNQQTRGAQIPWESSSLIGDFSFNPGLGRFIDPLPDTGSVAQRPSPSQLPSEPPSQLPTEPPNQLPSEPSREEPPTPQPTPPKPSAEPMKPPGNTTISRNGMQFQLKGCNRTGSSMRCELLITDESGSRNLCLHGRGTLPSTIVDSQGQQYLPERLEFGSGRANGYTCQDLTQGIGLSGVVFFKNMPTKFNQVPLVEFGFHRKQDRFKIQFQNVSIGP
jgi:Caspase domain